MKNREDEPGERPQEVAEDVLRDSWDEQEMTERLRRVRAVGAVEEALVHALHHFIADADIRMGDSAYAQWQTAQIRALLAESGPRDGLRAR